MSKQYLVLGDGPAPIKQLDDLGIQYHYIDLRKGIESDEIMTIYETMHPEMIGALREEILALSFDTIVVVGVSSEYRWNATIIARIFGQFNSWLGQYGNPFGHTVLNVQGKQVPLIALDSYDDWRYTHEI